MGGGDLLSILIQTIKSKMTGLVTKIKLWTNWNFVKNKIIIKIRDFFANLLGVKPRNKDDYYTIGNWMFSKRLLYALVIIIGVVSIWYISTETTIFKRFSADGVRTYKYNSFRLRTAKGHVKITGKSGYLAYEGNVENGYVTGEGTLYNKDGNVVYVGSFDHNKYEGNGTFNFGSGNIQYRGTFHENLYEGNGTLFREDGTRVYDGEFASGLKNGSGTLYDSGENEIFTGSFSSDNIVYSEFLGKTVAEANESYKGKKDLYTTSDESVVTMEDIGAVYHAKKDEEALDDDEKVDSVYVISDHYNFAGEEIKTIEQLSEIFGDPVYQGNSNVILPEAVAINELNEHKKALAGRVKMDLDQTFSDVAQVKSFDNDYVVYIYTFRRGDIMFSFVTESEGDNTFDFYYVTGANDDDAV